MQVLTLKTRSAFEDLILQKLTGYNRPVKTKHLADRLNIERADLVASLNRLRQGGLIYYTKEPNKKTDSRGRDDLSYGWVINP
jgi:predicted transcriptional regulator